MKHLDLFSGIKKVLRLRDHTPYGLSRHGRWGRESTPCPVLCSLQTASYRYADVVACGQCPAPCPHRTPDTHEGHQGIAGESASYSHQHHVCLGYGDSIQGSSVDASRRNVTETPLRCAWHSLESSVVDSAGPSLERTEYHIGDSVSHPSALLLGSLCIVATDICESSISATLSVLQKTYHKLCNTLSYSLCPCSHPYYTKLVWVSHGKGGA